MVTLAKSARIGGIGGDVKMLKNRKGASTTLIAVAVIIGLIVVAGGGFAIYSQLGEVKTATSTPKETEVRKASFDSVKFYVYNALDDDVGYGDGDVYGRIYKEGEVDWTGNAVETSTTYNGTHYYIEFNGGGGGTRLVSGENYELVLYQGDGGTNLYSETIPFTIPNVAPDEADYTFDETYLMYTEGSWTDAGCDNTNATFDEDATVADQVNLNTSYGGVGGLMTWDCTFEQATSGAILRDPVVIWQESPSDPLSDINDVEHIWMSVKSGSGIAIPTGDLESEFRAGTPIAISENGYIDSADSVVSTVKIELEAEGSIGTGTIQMIMDDLGDWRSKDTDTDVRAAAETISFKMYA